LFLPSSSISVAAEFELDDQLTFFFFTDRVRASSLESTDLGSMNARGRDFFLFFSLIPS